MIGLFKGEYKWLSNFTLCPIFLDGIEYPSVEHAYMSAKSDSIEWKKICSSKENTPAQVKKKSREIKVKDTWDNEERLKVMEVCLRQKFNQEPFKSLLLATNDEHIQEGNYYGDVFWGFDLKTDRGLNYLGKLIMKIRKEIQNV